MDAASLRSPFSQSICKPRRARNGRLPAGARQVLGDVAPEAARVEDGASEAYASSLTTHNARQAAFRVPTLPHRFFSVTFGGFRGGRMSLRISRPLGSRSLGLTPTPHRCKRDTFCQYLSLPFPLSFHSLIRYCLLYSTCRYVTMSLPYYYYSSSRYTTPALRM